MLKHDDEIDTVGGMLIFSKMQIEVPKNKSRFIIYDRLLLQFTVIKASARRILNQLEIKKLF